MRRALDHVVVSGVDLRSDVVPEPHAYWRRLVHAPLLRGATAGAIDARPAIDAALDAAGITPAQRLAARLGVFLSGLPKRAVGTGGAPAEEAAGIACAARAAQAIDLGHCDIAIALAIGEASGGDALNSAAVVFQPAGAPESRTLAVVRAVVAHPDAHWNQADTGNVLLDACAAAAIVPSTLTLLDARPAPEDTAELMLDRVSAALARRGPAPPHCAVGPLLPATSPVDSLMGLAAVALALHERALPPLASSSAPLLSRPFCAHRSAQPWIDRVPRRAAVWDESSGMPTAIVLEEAALNEAAPPPSIPPFDPLRVAFLSAATREGLVAECTRAAAGLKADPSRLASILEPGAAPPASYRVAVTGRTADDIAQKLDRSAKMAAAATRDFLQTPDGAFFGNVGALAGKTALIFPGQGGQYLGMFGDLCLFLRDFQVAFERLRDSYPADEICLPGLLVAPPAIGLGPTDRRILEQALMGISRGPMVSLVGSVRLQAVLRACGVRVDAMAGYSNGENAALLASGMWRVAGLDVIFGVARVVRTYDEDFPFARGISVAVNHPPRQVIAEALAASGQRVFIALDNCPDQLVLFGDAHAMRGVVEKIKAAGGMCVDLAFAHGHHTPAYAQTLELFRPVYRAVDVGPGQVPVYSCTTAAPFPDDPEGIRTLAARQWGECVRFGDTVERLYADGVRYFVEVGPGSTLTGFVRSVLKKRWHVAMASNVAGRPGPDQLVELLARLFVLGHDVSLDPIRHGYLPGDSFCVPAAGVAPAPSLAPLPVPADAVALRSTADRILIDHLELMNAFLDAQSRAHAQLVAQLGRGRGRAAAAPPSRPFPMLGDERQVVDGRLGVRRTFRRAADTFLDHHTLRRTRVEGTPVGPGIAVVPFTFSMEILAEAGAALGGWPAGALTLSQIRGSRWLALDGEDLSLDVTAEPVAGAPGSIGVRVFEPSASPTGMPAFQGVATAGAAAIDLVRGSFEGDSPTLPAAQFNDKIFHGDRLLSIDRVLTTNPDGIVLEAVLQPTEGLFAGDPDPALRTPAALLDAVSQLPAFWLAERQGLRSFGTFPFELKCYTQYTVPPLPGTRLTMRAKVWKKGHIIATTTTIYAPSGTPFAHIEDMRMRVMEFPDRFYAYVFDHHALSRLSDVEPGALPSRRLQAFPAELLDTQGIWLRVLAAVALAPAERAAMYALSIAERPRAVLARLAAKEIALDVIEGYGGRAAAVELETVAERGQVIVRGGALDELNLEIHVGTTADGTDVLAVLSACHAAAGLASHR